VIAGLLTADVLGLMAALVAAAIRDPVPPGVALTLAAAGIWVAATVVRERADLAVTAEVAAMVVFGVGLVSAALTGSPVWLTAALLVLAVVASVITLWRDDRRWARWVAVAAASAASWTVLNTLGVAVAEAYTAPPALLVIALGGVALRVRTDASSWRALGAGLGLLVTPTVVQVVDDPGDLSRLVAVIVGGSVLVVLGRIHRLQAPLVYGVGALTVVALAQHDVVTGLLPRWLLLAAGGALLLWLSISYERQLLRLAAVRRDLTDMR
jgi:hypothetical protein